MSAPASRPRSPAPRRKGRSTGTATGPWTGSDPDARPTTGHLPQPLYGDSTPPDVDSATVEQAADPQVDRTDRSEASELLEEVVGLRRRLATQPVIDQAKGVLIGSYGIDADTAFAVLIRCSQHTNTKLHLLAADLVAAASKPRTLQPPAAVRAFLEQLPPEATPLSGTGGPGNL